MAINPDDLAAANRQLEDLLVQPSLSKEVRSDLRFRQECLRKAERVAREGDDEAAQHFLWQAFDGLRALLEPLDENEDTS